MGKVKKEWQDRDTILAYFGKNRKKGIDGRIKRYCVLEFFLKINLSF